MSIMRIEAGDGEVSLEKSVVDTEKADFRRSDAFGTRSKRKRPLPPLRPCQWCNTEFRPKREDPKKPAKSCSPECRIAAWKSKRVDEGQITKILARLSAIESKIDKLSEEK